VGSGKARWGPGQPRGGDCMVMAGGVWQARDCLSAATPRVFLAEKIYLGDYGGAILCKGTV